MRWITRFFAWIGGIVVFLFVVLVVIGVVARKKTVKTETNTVLEMIVDGDFAEELNFLAKGKKMTLAEAVFAVYSASLDPKVNGLLIHLRNHQMSFSTAQELRLAVESFRKSGKKSIAYAESFGEFGPANTSYYLAAGCDRIFISQVGSLGITGFSIDSPFVKKTIEKLGIKTQVFARKEYKNAPNMFTESKFTPAHREAMDAILKRLHEQLVTGISEGRKLSAQEVVAAIDEAPIPATQALKLRLIDGIYSRDAAYLEAMKLFGSSLDKLLYINQYVKSQEQDTNKNGQQIAIIYGVGEVVLGQSKKDFFSTDSSLGAVTVAAAFRKAADDPDIKGVVFRINSPGGSYIASDIVYQAIAYYKSKSKPLVVSMGSVAASGGYFVAMAADKIFALPATLTGSIGVFAGKIDASTFLEDKLGVTFDSISYGKNAQIWSMLHPYTSAESEKINRWLDDVYRDFTQKAALGRKMTGEKIETLAKGRVWTGQDAKANGLVDEIGGLHSACEALKKMLGLSGPVMIVILPGEKDFLSTITHAWFDAEKNSQHDMGVKALDDVNNVFSLIRWLRMVELGLFGQTHGDVLQADQVKQISSDMR